MRTQLPTMSRAWGRCKYPMQSYHRRYTWRHTSRDKNGGARSVETIEAATITQPAARKEKGQPSYERGDGSARRTHVSKLEVSSLFFNGGLYGISSFFSSSLVHSMPLQSVAKLAG